MAATPIPVRSDRQLFVDDYLIEEMSGCSRRLHSPTREQPAIVSDRPWEHAGPAAERPWDQNTIATYGVAFEDGGRFRMWYRCYLPNRYSAYAESDDGVHWEKPSLGLIEFNGSTRNNLVWTGPGGELQPFRDGNPDVSDDERYKAVLRIKPDRLFILGSPDGLAWRFLQDEPITIEGPFDSGNVPFWDTWRREYVLYARGVAGAGNFKGGVRWIRRSTSSDFRSWTPFENIDCGDAPYEHLYTNACVQYPRAPGTYLMFPSRFVEARSPDPEWGSPGVNDAVFMSSRDGLRFDRSFMEAFVRPGLDKGNWHERSVYIETGVLQTSPHEISLYGLENSSMVSARLTRYGLRTDGFVSVNSGYSGGQMTTKPLTFTGGQLELNYSTSAVGTVKVEVQDAAGTPQPGFALDDCPEMFADEIEGEVRWTGGADLSGLAGTPIRLRFILKDADVYAFRFH